MAYLRRSIVISLFVLLGPFGFHASQGQERSVEQWLRGTGKNLELCLHGEVFESNGQPATEFNLSGGLNTIGTELPFKSLIEGSKFKVWIPANQSKLYSLGVKATSSDGKKAAFLNLHAYEFRKAAQEGVKLVLAPFSRVVEVHVTQNGQAVIGAQVEAEFDLFGEMISITDEAGVARLQLLPKQELSRLTAWTDDHRIGGYSFSSKPVRDSSANNFEVELSDCRDQKIRFVDTSGAPAAGIDFNFQVASAPPYYNYVGSRENSLLTTDAQGEATEKWFPDWDSSHYYPELKTDAWYLVNNKSELVDGVIVYQVNKSRPRKRVEGQVLAAKTDAAGFYLKLASFQGERENYSDILTAFSDEEGKFVVDVLLDATYCGYVIDSEWASETTDFIPYNSKTKLVTSPQLTVIPGQKVNIVVTSGAEKEPYQNLSISFRKEHRLQWLEAGKTRYGSGGPQWWVTTNELGQASTFSPVGNLIASIYTPLWRARESIEVVEGEVATVRFHRVVKKQRKFTGRLVLAEGMSAELANATLEIAGMGSDDDDRQTISTNENGEFSFEINASKIGLYASTQDDLAFAFQMIDIDAKLPLDLQLQPTTEFYGFLLDDKNQPLANHEVVAHLEVEGEEGADSGMPKRFAPKVIRTKSDPSGNYHLKGLPTGMEVRIYSVSDDENISRKFVEKINLRPSE